MSFNKDELHEFRDEAEDFLQTAEQSLLEVERGSCFKDNYLSICRSFHGLKEAAGLLDLNDLQHHMHKTVQLFEKFEESSSVAPEIVTFFLEAIDAARNLLQFKQINFFYELPRQSSGNFFPLEIAETPQNTPVELTDLIYIIDDEEDIVEILGGILAKYSLAWKGFSSPTEAMNNLINDRPIIVLSDMKMPTMSGIEVLRAVRDKSPETSVIFISGHLSKELLIEALRLGVDGVIEKPFKENPAITLIMSVLKEKKMWALLNKTIDLILFKLPELDSFLNSQGKHELASMLKADVEALLTSRRELRNSTKLPT